MNHDNTMKLYHDFPMLFRGLTWGFETGDGWFRLIYDLSQALEEEARKMGVARSSDQWPVAHQVKEKFGSLRFYVGTPDCGDFELNPFQKMVREADERSSSICERCGLLGELENRNGWLATLCKPCVAKILEERNSPCKFNYEEAQLKLKSEQNYLAKLVAEVREGKR